MNSRGANKILAIYWFTILVLVAGGISLMVFAFYHHPIDIRGAEADVLATRVADCISKNGKLVGGVLKKDESSSQKNYVLDKDFEENFLSICNLKFEGESENEWGTKLQYAVNVSFYNIGSSEPFVNFAEGNINYFASCEIKDKNDEKFRKDARCVYRGLYVVGEKDEQFLIEIISVVNKPEKNVR
jgi:hypothetical protein